MKRRIRIAAAVLCMIVGITTLAGCGKTIDGTKTVATVNGENLQLGVPLFFLRYEQASSMSMIQYFGMSEYFNSEEENEDGEKTTYGEQVKRNALDEVIRYVLIRQKAEEKGITLTDEERSAIDTAAQAFFDSNSEEVIKKVGATKENVVEMMSLLKYREKMQDEIIKGADTEVPDAEAQQSTVTYSRIERSEEDVEDTPDKTSDEYRAAMDLLNALKAEENVADADMNAIAEEINEGFYTGNSNFTTNDTTDTYLDAGVVDAVVNLSDGELADDVITVDEYYYVVRLDHVNDAEATETKKSEILAERRQTEYQNVLDSWQEEADITIQENILKTVTVTDNDQFLPKVAEETESE